MVHVFKQRDRGPEAGGDRQRPLQALTSDQALVALLLVLLVLQTAAKLYLALSVNLLWDEAHFVVAGRHPDWGYPDIPAGPALLAARATALFGDTAIGLRAVCLAAAQLLPLAVYFLTRQFCPHREAVWAAIITVFLPTTGLLGAFYYPEAFLQLALVLMLAFLVRAINDDRLSDWLLTGLTGAAGLFLHYRFALAGPASWPSSWRQPMAVSCSCARACIWPEPSPSPGWGQRYGTTSARISPPSSSRRRRATAGRSGRPGCCTRWNRR